MAQEIKYNNIRLEIIGENYTFVCQKCDNFRNKDPVAIRGHLAQKHKECPSGRVICPYCPATLWHMGNLKKTLQEK